MSLKLHCTEAPQDHFIWSISACRTQLPNTGSAAGSQWQSKLPHMLVAATATWSLSGCAASAQSQAPRRQARVFVIAHGGKAQADEFKKAAEWLQSAGHPMELHETKSPEDLSTGVKEYIKQKGGRHNKTGPPELPAAVLPCAPSAEKGKTGGQRCYRAAGSSICCSPCVACTNASAEQEVGEEWPVASQTSAAGSLAGCPGCLDVWPRLLLCSVQQVCLTCERTT